MNLLLALALTQAVPPKSVYHVSAAVDIPVTVGAGLVLAVPNFYADRLIKPRCPCDPNEVNAFDRGAIGNQSTTAAKLSDVTVSVAILAPLAFDAVDLGGFNQTWWEDAVVFGEVLAINGALVTAVKYIAQRPLPGTYAGDPSLIDSPEGYRSFYSGHASNAFAALAATAMTIRLRYGEKTWPWIVTGVVGTSVALERVAAGRHFPTDVITGAVMGTAVGIIVPWLHSRERGAGGGGGPQARQEPGGGMVLGWQLRF
jgi:membrane-associated phospholipid phosphatase